MPIRKNKSDSDASSDSSWTLINESDPASKNNSFENIHVDVDKNNATKELLEKTIERLNEDQNDEKNVELYEISCTSDKTSTHKNKKKKGKSTKKKGITLLTTFLPPNYAESADIENLQNHLTEIYEHTSNPSMENTVNSIQSTADALEIARSMDVLNIVSQNISDEEMCEAAFTEYYNNSFSPEDISELRIKIIAPYTKEIFEDSKKIVKPISIKETFENSSKSMVESVKDLVKSPTLQMLVATLVQDLCLIKLISEFSKRTREESSAEENDSKDPETKVLKITTKKSRAFKKKSIKPEVLEGKERYFKKNKQFKKQVMPSLPENQLLDKISTVYQNGNGIQIDENGKSECERRFEDLDGRWSTLGQNHRQKIQQIKDKFQREIFQIKESEKESLNRKQKIHFTREKFIQRLKADREIYLHRLRKLREEKQKVLNDICQNFKNSRSMSSKDVSVGNFAVLLPSDYSFVNKLQEEKRKEGSEGSSKLEAINNEGFSYVPVENENKAYSEKNHIDEVPKENMDHMSKEKPNSTKIYYELKKKYQRKRDRLIKKKQAKKDAREVQDVITNIVSSLSEATSKSLMGNSSDELPLVKSPLLEHSADELDFQIVQKKKANKRNLNKLYDAAFENQSKKIKKHDIIKWHKKFDDFKWTAPTDVRTKQDPLKSHRQKIINKGLL